MKSNKIHVPLGYKTFVTNCGIKDKTLDLAIVASQVSATAVALFTTNQVKGNPVLVGLEHIKKGKVQAVVVNSKNANVATGKDGYKVCKDICSKVSSELDIPLFSVFPSSTGVIGRRLPVKKILSSLNNLSAKLSNTADFSLFAKGIMTTDTVAKVVSAKVGKATITAVAKGSGMIEPNMATMLTYFFTDAKIAKAELTKIWKRVIAKSFNCLSIDMDMSTSDTALIMANSLVGEVDLIKFEKVLLKLALELTKKLARDGEGATKMFEVCVKGAKNDKEAKAIAKSIINSPLVKTAIYKGDPNWGRIYMAIGKTANVSIHPDKISLKWNKPAKSYKDIDALHKYLAKSKEILLTVDLQINSGSATVYGCDLTEKYVKINAYYTT